MRSLVGTTIRSAARPRRSGLIALAIAAAVVLMAVFGESVDAGIFGLLPFCLGLTTLIDWDARFRLDITATGLRDGAGQTILFTNLREVRALVPVNKPRGPSFLIEIVHAGGALVTPRSMTVRCEELYLFLRDRLAARAATLPPALTAFAGEQRATFGDEKVWSWGRRAGAARSPNPALRIWWIGGAVTGGAWMAMTWLSPRIPGSWRWIGLMTLVFSALFFLVDLAGRRGAGAVPQVAGLVISPAALALQLDELQGQLTWAEIQAVTYPAQGSFLAARAVPNSIAVDVEGARILITDSFTHPLNEIHERILRYWRSPV